jgi:putative transposase
MILALVDEAVQAGARQSLACEPFAITPRTLQRWKDERTPMEDQRPTAARPEPKNKLTQEEKSLILQTVNEPEYASKPPGQIVPILADQGVYIASESSFYRVMRAANEQHYRGRAAHPSRQTKPSLCASAPNQVWSWDISYMPGPIKGLYYYLYLIIDIFSRDIVGWEIWEEESAEHASQLIRRAVMAQGLSLSQQPLVLHSDNGSPMKGATMLATLYELGITPSRSRPRVSNDNPYSESMFKTIKYRPTFPEKGFVSLEASRTWMLGLVRWYRYNHCHSGIRYLTPNQLHTGAAESILENRRKVYEEARSRMPWRWTGETRDWSMPGEVWLNPVNHLQKNLRQLS